MMNAEETRTSTGANYKDRIVDLLKEHTRGLTDNQIAQSLGGTQQQTNVACRDLEFKGLIVRQRKGKPPRIHNISTYVLLNGLVNSEPAQWERHVSAMASTLGRSKGEVLDDVLRDFGRLILEETPAHEMLLSLIRSKEGKPDNEIMRDALADYINVRQIEHEPWEMKAQIIAEKRRESDEDVLNAAVNEYFAKKFVSSLTTGDADWTQAMQDVNQSPSQRERPPRDTQPAPTKVDLRDHNTEAVEPAQDRGHATLQTDAVVAEEDEPSDSPDPSTFQGREAEHGRDAAEEGTYGV